jgi:hypothetical protein
MDAFTIGERFRQAAPGADAIYDYLRSHPDLSDGGWRFDRATTDAVRTSWARFSRTLGSSPERHTLLMTAQLGDQGVWQVTHTIKPRKA